MRVLTAVLVVSVACGDNVHVTVPLEAISGSRLKVERYRYEDGAHQARTDGFFDVLEHARCTPRRWLDGSTRCVPDGDEAVYLDAGCSLLVGRVVAITRPTHFVAYDSIVGGVRSPARVFRSGEETAPVTEYFEMRDGVCRGPVRENQGAKHRELRGELAGYHLAELVEAELGDGRVGARILASDDGLQLPLALRDRELDVDCAPSTRSDASSECAPAGAITADNFRDPGCVDPVVAVDELAPPPTIAHVVDPAGCASFHAIAGAAAPPFYRRDRGACVPAPVLAPQSWFAVGSRLELPVMERSIESVPDRRLQRIVVGDGTLHAVADRLFDIATRGECRRHVVDGVVHCLPAMAPALSVYRAGCAAVMRVVELTEHACQPFAFASATNADDGKLEVHAIGDHPSEPIYQRGADNICRPYIAPPGVEVRRLGPPLPLDAFVRALTISDR